MGIIGKIFAIVMLPLSIAIFLDATGIFIIDLPFDKMLVGSILMIVLQLVTLFFVKITHKGITFMDCITMAAFSLPGIAYIVSYFMSLFLPTYIPIVLSVIMFVESIYALH